MAPAEQGKPPARTGRTDKPTTGRIGQLALMQMQSSSKLLAAAGSNSFSDAAQPTALVPHHQANSTVGGYGGAEASNVMKQTFESLNARDSSYNGRVGRFSKGPADVSARSGYSNDRIQVRIRGKNNEVARHTGSVTRTMDEMTEERKRKQEIAKAANRLKMLEKLEEYRENKMNLEIAQLEAERRREEEELRKARDKERKYAKYLERQKGKLADYAVEKQERATQQKKEEEDKRRKEKEQAAKFKRDQELKKKRIAEYKHKKAITADILANADLDDYYDEDEADDFVASSN